MNSNILWRVVSLVVLTVALSSQGMAQVENQYKLSGLINDYTPVLDAGGAWHVAGTWTLTLKGDSSKADFAASLAMVRADNETRSPHTHHVSITDAHVTALANGFRISGAAVMTGNGHLAGFSGAPVDVLVTGGNTVDLSNVSVIFSGGAVSHFGAEPLDGVVSDRR